MTKKEFAEKMFELKLQREILIREMDRIRDKKSPLYQTYEEDLQNVNRLIKKLNSNRNK